MIQKPSAWVPMAMSAAAFLLVVGYVSIYGVVKNHTQDEGTAAHIFQLLIAGQVPIIVYFFFKNYSKKLNPSIKILVLQILAMLLPLFAIYFLGM